MNPCINQVTTLSTPFEADIPAYAKSGWTSVEIWLTKLEQYLEGHTIAEARSLLDDFGVRAVAASSQGGLLLSRGQQREAHWDHYRHRLEALEALGVGTLVLAPDFTHDPTSDDLARAAGSLVEAAELARGAGIRLALEFQKTARFCASLDTTLALIAQCGADNLGVCLDLFHYYTGPSKFEDLAYLSSDNLAWLQLCDLSGTPRELAGDADRIFPGEGDFQLDPILQHLNHIGYDGPASLEVLNPMLWSIPVDRVADVAFQAMSRLLSRGRERGSEATRGGP